MQAGYNNQKKKKCYSYILTYCYFHVQPYKCANLIVYIYMNIKVSKNESNRFKMTNSSVNILYSH